MWKIHKREKKNIDSFTSLPVTTRVLEKMSTSLLLYICLGMQLIVNAKKMQLGNKQMYFDITQSFRHQTKAIIVVANMKQCLRYQMLTVSEYCQAVFSETSLASQKHLKTDLKRDAAEEFFPFSLLALPFCDRASRGTRHLALVAHSRSHLRHCCEFGNLADNSLGFWLGTFTAGGDQFCLRERDR